jgi:integrase
MNIDSFVRSLCANAKYSGRYKRCKRYLSVLFQIRLYTNGVYPSPEEVFTPRFLSGLQDHLIEREFLRNSISTNMNRLRAIHREAVKAGLLEDDPDLFDDVFTGTDPTSKRALTAEELARMYIADLSKTPHLQECRELFMLGFSLQGAAFYDMARLLKTDMVGDMITYRRSKTGVLVQVYVDEETRELLEKYRSTSDESPYLLNLITKLGEAGYKEYDTVLRRHNRRLKTLAKRLDLPEDLSSHSARHTWATLAHLNGAEIAVISQAMGHKTEEITHVYLSGMPREKFKEVNRIVHRAFTRPIREGRVQSIVVEPATRGGRKVLKEDAVKPEVKALPHSHTSRGVGDKGGDKQKTSVF